MISFSKSILATILMAGTLAACAQGEPQVDELAIKKELTELLHVQDKAWNAGDIDEFMKFYLKTDELRFASAGTVNRGWQATIEGYKTRYPDKAAMGELSFSDLEIKVLSPKYAQVFGRWALKRDTDNPGGLFTLMFERKNGEWLIISDHTSSNGN